MPIKEKQRNLHFPEFNGADYNESDDSSVSSDFCKEEQDVAVFMAIAKQLSMQSLMHLLQGQAQAALGSMYFGVQKGPQIVSPVKRVKKRFRFALDRDRNVRCQVFEIKSLKESDLWWSDDEADAMRMRAVKDVKHVRKNKDKYGRSVETIVKDALAESSPKQKYRVETAMKFLISNSNVRGLEFHIVPLLSQIRGEGVSAVMEAQEDLCRLPYEESSEKIAAVAEAFSLLSRLLAQRLASCDRVIALESLIAKW